MKKKRTFLALSCIIVMMGLFSSEIIAQCTPQTGSTTVGINPNPMPTGCAGAAYDEAIYFNLPPDTAITSPFPTTVTFTSYSIDNISNLPAGLSYTCNIPSCNYPVTPGQFVNGCGNIFGTPSSDNVGNSTITITYTANSSFGPFTLTEDIVLEIFPTPAVSFTSSSTALDASFSDTSPSAVSQSWDFGDGNTGTGATPIHTYATGGTYSVCLTIDDGQCTNTHCQNITVAVAGPCDPDPLNTTVGFDQDLPDGCVGQPYSYTIQFLIPVDTVYPPFGTISFDSLVIMNLPNLPAGLNYQCGNVTCVYEDDGGGYFRGCVLIDGTPTAPTDPANPVEVDVNLYSTVVSLPYSATLNMNIWDDVTAGFNYSVINNDSVVFTNTTAGQNAYNWDFGDSQNDTQENPSHVYAFSGNYTVCLTAENPCSIDQYCEVISLNIPFIPSCDPDTTLSTGFYPEQMADACVNEPYSDVIYFAIPVDTFISPSTFPIDSVKIDSVWNLPAGLTAECGAVQCMFYPEPGATHTYGCISISGTPTATTGPTDSVSVTGTAYVTILPGTVQTVSQAYNIALNIYDTPTGTISTVVSGSSVDFSVSGGAEVLEWDFGDGNTSTDQSPNHVYANTGTYTACADLYNSCDTVQVCTIVNIACLGPEAEFTYLINDLEVTFTNTSSGSGNTYSWDFDDGSDTTLTSPVHEFPAPGTYQVCLTASDPCGMNTFCESITVSCTPPTAGYTYTTNDLSLQLTNTATASPSTAYAWTFGDGNMSADADPQHVFDAPGTYYVCVSLTDVCGSTDYCDSIMVTCLAPTAGFSVVANDLELTFANLSSADSSMTYEWSFGDMTTSTDENPMHTYLAPNTYEVCLTATNICGIDEMCDSIEVTCPAPEAGFMLVLEEMDLHVEDMSTGDPDTWSWDFGDGTTATGTVFDHTYTIEGVYNVCLTVENICGTTTACDTIFACVLPVADFEVESNGLEVSTTNLSSGSVYFEWDFGDGTVILDIAPEHEYAAAGTYEICMIALDDCGETEICMSVEVCELPASTFSVDPVGDGTVTFTSSTPGISWDWDFGDGNQGSGQSTDHIYTADGTYEVCLSVMDSCGEATYCEDLDVIIIGRVTPAVFEGLDMFPNPTSGVLNVRFDSPLNKNMNISVYNLLGETMKSLQVEPSSAEFTLDLEDLPSGLYLVEVQLGDDRITKKIELRN